MVINLSSMVDTIGAFERILNTPIPLAYNIHLKQALNIYLIVLPFTLISDLLWVTPMIISVIAFTLIGIEGIGRQIENPFGYDDNDLPLDVFCHNLRVELDHIARHLPTTDSFLDNDVWNYTQNRP